MKTKSGVIKKYFAERGFGFIAPEDGGPEIFFHVNEAKGLGHEPHEGERVVYEEGVGRNSRPAAFQLRAPFDKVAEPEYKFLNPYNFVRYLEERRDQPDDPPEVQLLGCCPPPPHDRWVGLSGRIHCRATAVTPVFISDSEEVREEKEITEKKKHYSFQFFRLGGHKAIPATSLRGPVRSVFEMITNSCFAIFGGERLSYRIPSSETRTLVPARVEKDENDQFRLRLLPGEAPFEPDQGQKKGLYAAPARFYRAEKQSGRLRRNPPPPIGDPNHYKHGADYWAVLLEMKFPPSWRVIALVETSEAAEKIRADYESQGRFTGTLRTQHGWLCKTNQNADNKHSERFFYPLKGRRDVPETIVLDKKVVENYEALIKDYQLRHEVDVKTRHHPQQPEEVRGKKEMAFSRFILDPREQRLQGGELVYARVHGRSPNLQVEYLAPVSWPRVAYENSIADLLPKYLLRCDAIEALCPACRTFGWVHGKKGKDAYAGRVRFSHAMLEKAGEKVDPLTLAILGSPKPTTTRFYLVDPQGRPSEKRDDLTAGYDGNNGKNRLRGRKVFRHHSPDQENSLSTDATDQNRTIRDAEGKGAVFTFQVSFENLAPVELGALLWALTLEGQGYHRLGYGKPLGLGSVEVVASGVEMLDPRQRYASLDSRPYEEVTDWQAWVGDLINTFKEAAAHRWGSPFAELKPVKDLLALVGKAEPALPVHYPRPTRHPDPKEHPSFEWFVGNKRDSGPKLELALASEDDGLPLIEKDGTRK